MSGLPPRLRDKLLAEHGDDGTACPAGHVFTIYGVPVEELEPDELRAIVRRMICDEASVRAMHQRTIATYRGILDGYRARSR